MKYCFISVSGKMSISRCEVERIRPMKVHLGHIIGTHTFFLLLWELLSSKVEVSWCFISFTSELHLQCYTRRPRQNGRRFPDNIFKCIFLNENTWISIKISLKFVPKGPINNISALVEIMAWRRISYKPLSEPMMTQFNEAYLVTRPQWVNT